jgi:hypothetical protein
VSQVARRRCAVNVRRQRRLKGCRCGHFFDYFETLRVSHAFRVSHASRPSGPLDAEACKPSWRPTKRASLSGEQSLLTLLRLKEIVRPAARCSALPPADGTRTTQTLHKERVQRSFVQRQRLDLKVAQNRRVQPARLPGVLPFAAARGSSTGCSRPSATCCGPRCVAGHDVALGCCCRTAAAPQAISVVRS